MEVALDTGEIVGLNTLAYLTSHNKRELPKPSITEEEIREKLNKNLKVKRIRMALIPDSALREKFCYEVDVQWILSVISLHQCRKWQ